MKRFSIFLSFIMFLTLFNSARKATFSDIAGKNQAIWKARLLDTFFLLDIEKIINADKLYLDSIGAEYDSDNGHYFIEPRFSDSAITDECFIFIEQKKSREIKITIYPPDSDTAAWLRARAFIANGTLVSSIIFEPVFFHEEHLKVIRPVNDSQSRFASINPEK